MDCAENDLDDTCAESIDSCAVSFWGGEVNEINSLKVAVIHRSGD